MRPTFAFVAVSLALALGAAAPAFAEPDPAAEQVLAKLEKDRDARAALEQIDALLKEKPKSAARHYARGFILSAAGQKQDAATEYRAAVKLDPKMGSAWYNLGNVSADLGKEDDALSAWDQAAKVEPKAIDAWYNAGQLLYNKKAYAKALAHWEQARKLAPDDFDILKKMVQATYALDKVKDGERLRGELVTLWKGSKLAQVQRLSDYVFDQFDLDAAGKVRVFAYAILKQADANVEVIYSFRAVQNDRPMGARVEVETSEVAKNGGTPYVLSMTDPAGKYSVVGSAKVLQAYPELRKTAKSLLVKAIARP